MPTPTTIKIPEKLKSRIAALAKAAGKTAHAFMLDAFESQADFAEQRKKFVATARSAEQEVAAYGLVHDADEVFAYMKAKAAGKKARRPKTVHL